MPRIGIISDTHNYLDPRVAGLFAGVEHILHAGDIGSPRIILELEQIAPVTAVLGNTDEPAFRFRLTELAEVANRKFLLHHIVNPLAPSQELLGRLQRDRPDVVVFGHTHKPFNEVREGVLFLNPGYAGKTRFAMPRTVAILHCEANELCPEFLPLD